jgi:hypothetical protein
VGDREDAQADALVDHVVDPVDRMAGHGWLSCTRERGRWVTAKPADASSSTLPSITRWVRTPSGSPVRWSRCDRCRRWR